MEFRTKSHSYASPKASPGRSLKLTPVRIREQTRDGYKAARQQRTRRMVGVLLGLFVALACFLTGAVVAKSSSQVSFDLQNCD